MSQEQTSIEPVLVLIAQIKDRKLDPKQLSTPDRQRCVEMLRSEGYSVQEIAQILRRDERTIYRDLGQIRSEHALAPDPHFSQRMIGEMLHQAEISMTRLRKIARESDASAMERLMAETSAWKVYREVFEALQSVGYLPRVPAGVVAEVHVQTDSIASYDDLEKSLHDLIEMDALVGTPDPERARLRQALEDEITRAKLNAQVKQLTAPPPPEPDHG